MNRMRLFALVSGLAALAMPAVAGAQSAVGGDKYGGAEVGEDLGDTGDTKDSDKSAEPTKKKAAPKTVEEPLMPEDSESTTTEPVEDETQDTIRKSPPASTTGPDADGPDLGVNVDVDERTTTP